MLNQLTTITWDRNELASALGLSDDHLNEWAQDGRNMNALLQLRIASELEAKLISVSGGSKLVVTGDSSRFRVRCVNKNGVSFAPSYMLGHGRAFNEKGFRSWLAGFDGFLVANILDWPVVDIFQLSCEETLELYEGGHLDEVASLPLSNFLELTEPEPKRRDSAADGPVQLAS